MTERQLIHQGGIPIGYFQEDTAVLPMSVVDHLVDILVRHIESPGKGCVPIHNAELTMVPVVEPYRQNRHKAVEYPAADPLLLQKLWVIFGQSVKTPHVIVNYPHIHPGLCFLLQDLQH